MASEGDERGGSVSFTFSKKKAKSKLVCTNEEYANDEREPVDAKDFIHSAEGKLIKSVKAKESAKELVIPCLLRNDFLAQQGKGDKINTLDRQAAEEIISDLSKAPTSDSETGTNFAIPLLAKTHLVPAEGTTDNVSEAAATTAESTLEDYDTVPVTEYGAAMLRGMGWKKGEAIGGTNKGLTVPIEFIPRSQGLGLGAERRHEENVKKKRRKPGDVASNKNVGPIVENNGRVRHYRSLDEKIPEKKAHEVAAMSFSKGSYVRVMSGPHKDLSGKITAMDEDNARVFVCLAINSEEVTISQHNIKIIDMDDYKQFSKGKPSQYDEKDHRKTKRRRGEEGEEGLSENNREYSPKKHKSKHKKDNDDKECIKGTSRDTNEHGSAKDTSKYDKEYEPCWMAPLIRVRIISKSFKKGNYYHKKVVIQDVVTTTLCVCETDEGRLLEDVPQSIIETVIPKSHPRIVLFVQGKHKGLFGEIVETQSSKQQAIIQILSDKSVVKSHYDDISEYTGDVHGE